MLNKEMKFNFFTRDMYVLLPHPIIGYRTHLNEGKYVYMGKPDYITRVENRTKAIIEMRQITKGVFR